jgi:hypothetical protein
MITLTKFPTRNCLFWKRPKLKQCMTILLSFKSLHFKHTFCPFHPKLYCLSFILSRHSVGLWIAISLSLSNKLWIMSCTSIWHACAFTLFWHLSVNWQNWLSPKINRFKRSHFFWCHLHTLCLRTTTLFLPQRAPFHASLSLSLSLSLYLINTIVLQNWLLEARPRPFNPTRTLFHAALYFTLNRPPSSFQPNPHPLSRSSLFQHKFWNKILSHLKSANFKRSHELVKFFCPTLQKSPTHPLPNPTTPLPHSPLSLIARHTHTLPPQTTTQPNTPPPKLSQPPSQPYPQPTSALDIPHTNFPKPLHYYNTKHLNTRWSLRLLNGSHRSHWVQR